MDFIALNDKQLFVVDTAGLCSLCCSLQIIIIIFLLQCTTKVMYRMVKFSV